MKTGASLAAFAAAVLWCAGASATPTSWRDPAREEEINAELRARDPQAADLFAEATAAVDHDDADRAATLLEQVREQAPWFVHATRRLCGVERRRGHRDRAIALCREAVAAEPSPENEAALAVALVEGKGRPPQADVDEALRLARDASFKEERSTPFTQTVLCQCALAGRDLPTLTICAERLKRIAPEEVSTHYFATIDAAAHGDTSEAERQLEVARAKGLPDDAYSSMQRMIDESRPPIVRWGLVALRGFVGWLAGFALLLGLGALLSSATLRAVARVPVEATGHARGSDAALRRTYRVVLWATCVYYYASLPVVAVLVVALGAGVVYACLAIGNIPVKLVLIAAVVVFGSLWAIVKSIFVRVRDEDPGEKLDLRENAKLRAVLDSVAARIGTRAVDSVYMTPAAEVAVFERGGMLKQVRGKSERCLVLGAAVLDGMRVRELKAILAHEYGHFHNEDTAGGGFALAVRRSVMVMVLHLVRAGAVSVLNPTWWFVRGFYAVFLRVSQGASRLQEILADRWAAFAYGPDAFTRGLTHVVDRSVRFDAHLSATLGQVVPSKVALTNLYAFVPQAPVDPEKVDKAITAAMNRTATASDSHPPPADRIAWVAKLAAPTAQEEEGDADDAWSLLSARTALEERMTAAMRALLAQQGIRVQGPATKTAAPSLSSSDPG
jgi:Zn-dependent protease with chaperone function